MIISHYWKALRPPCGRAVQSIALTLLVTGLAVANNNIIGSQSAIGSMSYTSNSTAAPSARCFAFGARGLAAEGDGTASEVQEPAFGMS